MIRTDLATALDPAYFMQQAGYPPDQWQRDLLRSRAPRSLVMCSRQSGKSTTVAAIAAHCALFEADSLILVLAPSRQQAAELFRKISAFVRGLALDLEAETQSRIEFENRSRVLCLSGNAMTVRGFSAPRLVIIDEAAFADPELYHAISPMLSGGGRLIMMSTPNGRQGNFWELWSSDDPSWQRTRVTADDSSRISPEFLALERASKPDWRIRQEYFCEFVDTDEMLFPSELVAQSITPAVRPLFARGFRAFTPTA